MPTPGVHPVIQALIDGDINQLKIELREFSSPRESLEFEVVNQLDRAGYLKGMGKEEVSELSLYEWYSVIEDKDIFGDGIEMIFQRYGRGPKMDLWLKCGAKIPTVMLWESIENGDIEYLEYLIANGADVNGFLSEGYLPIQAACMRNQKSVFDFLIEKGAKTDGVEFGDPECKDW